MSSPHRTLTAEQVDSFWRNGWLAVEDLLSPDDVARIGERADQIARGETGADPQRVQAEKLVREGEVKATARELRFASSTG